MLTNHYQVLKCNELKYENVKYTKKGFRPKTKII